MRNKVLRGETTMKKVFREIFVGQLKAISVFAIVGVLLISLHIAALADGGLSITDSGLTLTGDWATVEGSMNSFTKTVSTTSCDAVSSTLTISVEEGMTGILEFSFDTTYTGTNGSYEIKHGNTVLTGENGKYTVHDFSSANNVTIKISTSSKKNSSKTGTVSGVTFTEKKTVSIQFEADPLGIMTYTVDGQSIANPISKETGTTISYAITNSNDSNYVLAGWHWSDGENEGYFSVGSTAQRNGSTGTVPVMGAYTMTPVVAYYTEDSAPLKADDEYWWTWETAMSVALESNDKIVTQVVDYALPATLAQNGLKTNGKYVTYDADATRMTYTIPSGAKLLVPYNANDTGDFDATPTMRNPGSASSITCYPNDPITARDPSVYDTMTRYGNSGGIDKLLEEVGKETFAKGMYAYRTLTVPANTTIDVKGALNVNSRVFVFGHHETGTPASTHGQIKLEAASSIINVTGNLYCYGFITGAGTVYNYGNVYELLQITDWRGATAASQWEASGTTNFLFSQYYVQNIECSYVVNNGSMSHAVVSLAVSKMLVQQNRPFIGNESTSGFFTLTSGKLTRNYVPLTERTVYSVEGDLSMDSITIEQNGVDFTSSDYVLPLQNNIEINLVSGTTTITNDVKMLPNSSITVGRDATLVIADSAELYIYDKNDWKATTSEWYTIWLTTGTNNFGASSWGNGVLANSELYDNYGTKILTTRYSPTRGLPSKTPTEVSAKLTVNGTLEANGNVFSSENTTAITYDSKNYDVDTSTDAAKILYGAAGATFTNGTNSETANWAKPTLMETIQKDNTKAADTHVNITAIPVVARIKGITANSSSYNSLGIGTYHALSDNYWYNYKITSENADKITVTSTLAADGTAGDDVVGYVSYYTVDNTNTQSTFTFTVADGYKVSAKTIVDEVETVTELASDANGVYSLSDVQGDINLVLTKDHKYVLVESQDATLYSDGYEKYRCSECGDEYTVILPCLAVAEVNGVRYATLTEALTAAPEGFTIKVFKAPEPNVVFAKHVRVDLSAPECSGYEIAVNTELGYAKSELGENTGIWQIAQTGKFNIAATNMKAGDSLALYFYVQVSDLPAETANLKAVLSREGEEDATIAFDQWTSYGEGAYYRFAYNGIAAKEMTNVVTVRIYDGDELISNPCSESVENYAVRLLKSISAQETVTTVNEKIRTTVVDMLNYGAECQNHFLKENAGKLANVQISNWQEFATQSVEYADNHTADPLYFFSPTVTAENSLIYTFYFYNIDPEATKAVVTYTNHYNKPKSAEIEYRIKNTTYNGESLTLYAVDVEGLSVADGRQIITCNILNEDGTVLTTASGSVEDYAARAIVQMPEDKDVFLNLLKFVDSSYAYFRELEKK